MVGFDHIYIYDNTGAHSDGAGLAPVLRAFNETEVTRIDWPFRVCNNNAPAHENCGERSSQYAAESSCRARFGPFTEWIAAFDPDEYLVPMGEYEDLKDMLRNARKGGTNIIGFKSTRAMPVAGVMEPAHDEGRPKYDKGCGEESNPTCLKKREDRTFLETYNCDSDPLPKPSWSVRAKKQIYRPDYVLSHYVHYSTISQGLVQTYKEHQEVQNNLVRQGFQEVPKQYPPKFQEGKPSERFTDEKNEAVMIHSKTAVPEHTRKWQEQCKLGFVESHGHKCRVGYHWPDNKVRKGSAVEDGVANEDGMMYNCFQNLKVRDVWVPRLKEAMEKRLRKIGVDGIRREDAGQTGTHR